MKKKQKGHHYRYPRAPRLTSDFFLKTSKELQDCYQSLLKHGVIRVLIETDVTTIILKTKEAFLKVTKDMPAYETKFYPGLCVMEYICKPTGTIHIVYQEFVEEE